MAMGRALGCEKARRFLWEHRKIAAILDSAVVGFSRLTGVDEDRTLARTHGKHWEEGR